MNLYFIENVHIIKAILSPRNWTFDGNPFIVRYCSVPKHSLQRTQLRQETNIIPENKLCHKYYP